MGPNFSSKNVSLASHDYVDCIVFLHGVSVIELCAWKLSALFSMHCLSSFQCCIQHRVCTCVCVHFVNGCASVSVAPRQRVSFAPIVSQATHMVPDINIWPADHIVHLTNNVTSKFIIVVLDSNSCCIDWQDTSIACFARILLFISVESALCPLPPS